MALVFADIPEACRNTLAVAERCNLTLDFGRFHLPKYVVPEGHTLETYLQHLAREGLRRRYGPSPGEAIEARLGHELAVIEKMGFAGYFLVVWDFIHYAREHGIAVGPGRGSSAGSLVAYCLGITNIDPMRYGLLFERFLNPERVSMPDMDIDFADDRRDEVIRYVADKYGRDRVAHIITFGTLGAKAAIRDVGRVLGMTYAEVDRIAKLVPNFPLNIPLDDAKAYALLTEAKTFGVFQLESSGMREALRGLKPERLEDVIAMVSLYRPGPMDLIPDFIARKHGRAKIAYEHPAMEKFTRETYGIMVYQEQIMQIASEMAGFTMGEADILRRAMGKKDRELMAKQREKFITGCRERNTSAAKAERVWELMEKFAGYGFNKCLTGDTLIEMADGSCKPITAIHEGDLVLTKDGPFRA